MTVTLPTHRAKRLSLLAQILTVIGSVGLDQTSKFHAQSTLMEWEDVGNPNHYQGRRHPIWSVGSPFPQEGGQFHLSFSTNYVRNLGAAWGTLSELPDFVRVPFFYIVTVVAVLIIALYMRSTPMHHRLARFALALILSGAIGNFIDRVRLGYVIDWIDVRWNLFGWWYNFPNFNIADCAITVGVSCLIFDMLVLEAIRRRGLTQSRGINAATA